MNFLSFQHIIVRIWGRTITSLRGNIDIAHELASAFKYKPCFGIHAVNVSGDLGDLETHKQPLQRIVSRKCSGWSGEDYLKSGKPDYYLVYQKQMFGQALCSSCRNISSPKSSETPDNQILTSTLDEEGENATVEHDEDVKVVIPIRKSDRRRTKSFKLKEQDELTLREAKRELKMKNALEDSDFYIENDAIEEYAEEHPLSADAQEDGDFNGENLVVPPSNNSTVLDEKEAFEEYATNHVKIVEDGKKTCLLCDKVLAQTSYLKRHFLDRHCKNYPDFKCPCCDHLFKSDNSLRKHLSTYHPDTYITGDELQKCRVSTEELEDQFEIKKNDLEPKTKTEDNINPSSCLPPIQNDQMDTQSEIEGHEICDDCGKTIAKFKLSGHMRRVHLKEKNVTCEECGAAFFDKVGLRRHMEKHKVREGKESLFPCGECGARFNSKLDLKKHRRQSHKVKKIQIRAEEPLHPGTGPLAIAKKEGSDELVIHSNLGAHLDDEYKGSKPPLKDLDLLKLVFPDGVCPFCESAFKQMYYLSLHLKLKHAFDWYQCPSCNIWRNRPGDIAMHCAEVHGEREAELLCPCCKVRINVIKIEEHSLKCFLFKYKRPMYWTLSSFKCRLCSKVMPSRTRYEKHLRSSHDEEIFKCSHEGCTYISIPDSHAINTHLSRHEKTTTSEKTATSDPVICDICGRTFHLRGLLLNHMKMEHSAVSEAEAKFPCPECDDVFGSRKAHQYHLNVVHLKLSYDCEKCEKTFRDPDGLRQHERKVHNREMLRVQCDICAEWSSNKECLDNHIRNKHTGEKPFPCTFCDEAFTALALMTSHRKRYHPDSWREEKKRRKWLVENKADPSGFKMQCHLCNQTTVTIDELRSHWNADHPGQTDISNLRSKSREAGPGICPICGQSFDTLFGLHLHYKKTHHASGETRTCEFCGQEFDSEQGIRTHIARAHQEKTASFKCSVCGEVFHSQDRLSIHKQDVHQIELMPCMRKNSVCDICGKNGMTRMGLKYHMKTHAANRPKKCTYCDKEFETYSNMTRHRKIAHAEQWKVDKDKLHYEEGGSTSKSQRERIRNYQKEWYERNRERMRELERERARAKRTGEKYVCPPRP